MSTNKNLIGSVASHAVKLPVAAAGTAVGLAEGAARKVASVAKGARGGRSEAARADADAAPAPTDVTPAPTDVTPDETSQETAPAVDEELAERIAAAPDEPVNVTEELGLDPAPVEKPKRKKADPKPVTKIDAEADADEVDVTPADIAKAVSPGGTSTAGDPTG